MRRQGGQRYVVEAIALLTLGGAAWLLWDSLKAREAANLAIRGACKAQGYLLLDDTVGLESLRPARDEQGRLRLRRTYRFDYSDTGDNRQTGRVTLRGDRVVAVAIEASGEPPNPRQ